MYTIDDLKPQVHVTDDAVECPVAGCARTVARQRKRFVASPEYLCPEHGIFISPSTFEYAESRRNFPLIDDSDWDLLHTRIAADKRETHRLARERSEDAVTYNAFRSIERAGRLPEFLTDMLDREQQSVELVYWSYCLSDGGTLPLLDVARATFGERPRRGSEPDLIAITPTDLVFIEVKLTSSNETTPSRVEALQGYATGADRWYEEVFASDPYTVAVDMKKYELMRFWLLGSWMARRMGVRFSLVSLTREIQDMDLDERVAPLLRQSDEREFFRWPWESVAGFAARDASTKRVSEYLWSKSVGYDGNGVLQPMLHQIVY